MNVHIRKYLKDNGVDPSQHSKQDLIELFTKWKDDNSRHFHDRDLCEHYIKILGEHKFWNNQAIVTPSKVIKKVGEIKKFKPEDIPDEPIQLPPGFIWSEFDVDNDE